MEYVNSLAAIYLPLTRERNDPVQIRVLENQAKEHTVVLGKEYVSRHQVEEMETLFEKAVEGLSNRLRDMEKRNAQDHGQVNR